jgi:Na+-driven multidrug efflux pump
MTDKNKKPQQTNFEVEGAYDTRDNQPLLDKKQVTNPESVTKKDNLGLCNTIWLTFSNGILTTIAVSDFYLVMIICFLLVRNKIGEDGVSALNYSRIILDLVLLTGNYAMVENLGIYGSQAYGKGDKKRTFQLFCQASFVITIYFLLTVFPVINYSDDVLDFIGFEGKLTELIRNLEIWLAPAFLIKMITDQLKTFFFCHRKFNMIGLLNLVGMAIIGPFIYIRSKNDTWKSSDLGWALIIYQLINLVMCYFAYRINFNE